MMKDTISDTEWLTPGEAAELLNVHISTIYRWGEKDKIKLYQVGQRTRLNRAEID
jgi:excisionase family DNA binding protein